MTKYLLRRILHGILSVICVVAIVMLMIYSWTDRTLIFAQDTVIQHTSNNAKEVYRYRKWKEYGYIYYVTYADYMRQLKSAGDIDEETRAEAVKLGRKADKDSDLTAEYVAKFTNYYESEGYTVVRLDAKMQGKKVASGGSQQLFAYKDRPLISRILSYFGGLFEIDKVSYVNSEEEMEAEAEADNEVEAQPALVGERGLSFTFYDPVYGGEKFSPAVIGNGTKHKYLLYFDGNFPYIHQNLLSINLGKSYVVNQGIDVFDTMTQSQGSYVKSTVIFPSGLVEESADDLHTAVYMAGSRNASAINASHFTDDYTSVSTQKNNLSKMGYSFVIGIMSVILTYLLGVPLGIVMARKKDKLVDKIGTIYIVFILAVPSLAYIFLFKAIGGKLGLPTVFDMESSSKLMYVLPVISLALPAVANLMKWLRRYMIDQMNSDYVKFARSGGLSEGEIFKKHIMKNAIIPLIHDIPASVLGCLIGAIITERVYVVPGAGNLLTQAINAYDNGVIVGVTLFYAVLSVTAIILGDVLMSMVDPRISFSSKAR